MADRDSAFNCNLCLYNTNDFSNFRKHYLKHKNDPHFQVACCIGHCGYTTSKWGAYRVHVHRKHPEYMLANDPPNNNVYMYLISFQVISSVI